MRLEFEYTPEDFAEAARAHTGGPFTWRRFGAGGWLILVTLLLAFGMLIVLPRSPSSRSSAPAGSTGSAGRATPIRQLLESLPPSVPWVLIFLAIWFYLIKRLRSMTVRKAESSLYEPGAVATLGRARWGAAWGPDRVMIGLVLLLAVASGIITERRESSASSPSSAAGSSAVEVLLPALPWIIVFVGVIFFVRLRRRSAVRRGWELQPQLQRPKTAEFGDNGFWVADAASRHETTWEGVTAVKETPNLFLLYVSHLGFHMIPKRAFATPVAVSEFRELLRNRIVDRPGPAFAVVPLQASATPNPIAQYYP